MITAWPKPQVWRETLAGLDFLTCIDLNFTADCAYADLVLPAATWYEIESYMTYGPIFRVRERVIEPLGEARNAFFIFAELAGRLGYGQLYPPNEDELLRQVLKGSPFTLEEVRAAGGQVQVHHPPFPGGGQHRRTNHQDPDSPGKGSRGFVVQRTFRAAVPIG